MAQPGQHTLNMMDQRINTPTGSHYCKTEGNKIVIFGDNLKPNEINPDPQPPQQQIGQPQVVLVEPGIISQDALNQKRFWKTPLGWVFIGLIIFVITGAIIGITLGVILTRKDPIIENITTGGNGNGAGNGEGKDDDNIIDESERLVVSVKREINEISRYHEKKTSTVSLKIGDSKEDNVQEIYTDLLFNIYDMKELEESKTTVYYAYAVLINITLKVEEDSSFLGGFDVYDETPVTDDDTTEGDTTDGDSTEGESESFPLVNETCNDNSPPDCKEKILSIPFVKFSFFKNGTLDEIYKPSLISNFIWSTMIEAVRKFTPVLSQKMYEPKTRRILQELDEEEDGVYLGNVTEVIERDASTTNGATVLNEDSINFDKINGLEITDSQISSKTKTTVDGNQGKISTVSSTSECHFTEAQQPMDEIPIDPNSPFDQIDKKENTANVKKGGFESLSSKVESTFDLDYSRIEVNTTEYIRDIISTITFSLVPKEEITEDNRLRRLIQFPYKEYKKDLSKIPTEINLLRELTMNSFEKPIEFSYGIFYYNLIGFEMALNVVLSTKVKDDTSKVTIVLCVGKKQLELCSITKKINILDRLLQANKIVEQLSNKLINLANEITTTFDTVQSPQLLEATEKLHNSLLNAFTFGKIFNGPFSILSEKIKEIANENMTNLLQNIYDTAKAFEDLLAKIEVNSIPLPEIIIQELRNKAIDYFNMGNTTFIKLHNQQFTYFSKNLQTNIATLPSVQSKIFVLGKANIEKLHKMYDDHVDTLQEGIIKGINDRIRELSMIHEGDLKDQANKIVENLIVTLTQNPVFEGIVDLTERIKLVQALRSIQSYIQKHTETLFNSIRVTKDAFATHPITKDIDTELKGIVAEKKRLLTEQTTIVLNELNTKYYSTPLSPLLSDLHALDDVENNIKLIKIEAFQTYFNFKEIMDDFTTFINKKLYDTMHPDIIKHEDNLQMVISDVRSRYQNGMNEIIIDLSPIKTKIQKLFAPEILQHIYDLIPQMIIDSENNAIRLINDNFIWINRYVTEMINIAWAYRNYYKQYRTALFYRFTDIGRNNMSTLLEQIKQKITQLTFDYVKKLKDEMIGRLNVIIENKSLQFLIIFKEFSLMKDYIEDFKYQIADLEAIHNKIRPEIEMKIHQSINNIQDFFNQKVHEYNLRIQQNNWLRYSGTMSCHFYYTRKTHRCWPRKNSYDDFYITPASHNAVHEINYNYNIGSLDNNLQYKTYIDQQNEIVAEFDKEIGKCKEKVEALTNDIVDNNQALIEILDSWKTMAFDFEATSLNNKLKDDINKVFKTSIQDRIRAFNRFSRTYLNIQTNQFYEQFKKTVYTFKPVDIPFRFNQLVEYAQAELGDIAPKIEQEVIDSLNYHLKVFYKAISNQYLTFLKTFMNNFVADNTFFGSNVQERIDDAITAIQQHYDTKLASIIVTVKDPNDIYGLQWLINEFNIQTMPQLLEIQKDIESWFLEINLSGLPIDNSRQSEKLDFTITDTLIGNHFLYGVAENSLNGCLKDFDSDVFMTSFKEVSQSNVVLLKKELLALNKRMDRLEEIIKTRINDSIRIQINKLFPISSVTTPFIEDIFDMFIDTDDLLYEIFNIFIEDLSETFQNELTQIGATVYEISPSYFPNLFNEIKSTINQALVVLLREQLNTIYSIMTMIMVPKFTQKIEFFLDDIDFELNNCTHLFVDPLPIMKTEYDLKAGIVEAIRILKLNAVNYSTTISNLIDTNFNLFKDKINKLPDDVDSKVDEIIAKMKKDYVKKFSVSEDPNAGIPSDTFAQSIDVNLKEFIDSSIKKITDFKILERLQDRINSINPNYDMAFDAKRFTPLAYSISADSRNQINDEVISVKKNIGGYLQLRLTIQPIETLTMLFHSNEIYNQIKNKCFNDNINLSQKVLQDEITIMSNFIEHILSTTSEIDGDFNKHHSLFFGYIEKDFIKATDLDDDDPRILNELEKKLSMTVNEYLLDSQHKVIEEFFSIVYKEILANTELDGLSLVIKEQIHLYDIEMFKKSFQSFYGQQKDTATTMFVEPVKAKIAEMIQATIVDSNKQLSTLEVSFGQKTITSISSTEIIALEVLEMQRGIMMDIMRKISDYSFTLGDNVNQHFNTLYSRYNKELKPITNSLDDIKKKIEVEVDLTLAQMPGITDVIRQRVKLDILANTKAPTDILNQIVNGIKSNIIDKVTSFEGEIYQFFFPTNRLRRVSSFNSLRQTVALQHDITEIKDALITLKMNVDRIHSILTSLHIISKLIIDFDQFRRVIDSELVIIKDPINVVINQINTLLDQPVTTRIETTVDGIITEIKIICESSKTEVQAGLLQIPDSFKNIPDTILLPINDQVSTIVDGELVRLLDKVLSKLPPINDSKNEQTPLTHIVTQEISVAAQCIVYNVEFAYGYDYKLEVVSKNHGIFLLNQGSGYGRIEAKGVFKQDQYEYGGTISGLVGDGKVANTAQFSFNNFGVNNIAQVDLKASSYTATVLKKYPATTEYVRQCYWLGMRRKCITVPVINQKIEVYGTKTYTTPASSQQWIKDY